MQTSSAAWLTATEALQAIGSRELSPPDMVAAHLERIARVNPSVAAYVHVDERASAGDARLAGVTLAVKDTQPVRGMPWTYGSRRWRDRVAEEDGSAVAHARKAGATLLGKTNTPELAASVGTGNELIPRSPGRLRVAVVESSALSIDEPCRAACARAAAALNAAGHELEPAAWDPAAVAEAYQVVRPVSVADMPGEPSDYGEAAGRLIAT